MPRGLGIISLGIQPLRLGRFFATPSAFLILQQRVLSVWDCILGEASKLVTELGSFCASQFTKEGKEMGR